MTRFIKIKQTRTDNQKEERELWIAVNNPEIGTAVTFPAYGKILISAIKRTSKNRHAVYVITKNNVAEYRTSGLTSAVEVLQGIYDSEGEENGKEK